MHIQTTNNNKFLVEALQNKIVSSANKLCEMLISSVEPLFTLNPFTIQPSNVHISIALINSITRINSKGKSGSPCLNPLKLLKKPGRESLTSIKQRTVETHILIFFLRKYVFLVLMHFDTYNTNFSMTVLSLLASTLAKILYKLPTKLMGQKSLKLRVLGFFYVSIYGTIDEQLPLINLNMTYLTLPKFPTNP